MPSKEHLRFFDFILQKNFPLRKNNHIRSLSTADMVVSIFLNDISKVLPLPGLHRLTLRD